MRRSAMIFVFLVLAAFCLGPYFSAPVFAESLEVGEVPTCTIKAEETQDFNYKFTIVWSGGSSTLSHKFDYGRKPTDLYASFFYGDSGTQVQRYIYPYELSKTYTPTITIRGDEVSGTCFTVITTQAAFAPATCEFDARQSGDKFNHWEYLISWKNAFGDSPYLEFGDEVGDEDRVTVALGFPYVNGSDDWGEYWHDYPWDISSGYSEYVAKLVVPSPQEGIPPTICEVNIAIVDPIWGGHPHDLPECDFEFRKGDPFNHIEFKGWWKNASGGIAYIDFGDGATVLLTLGPNHSFDWGVYSHDYQWDESTGYAAYQAKLVVPWEGEIHVCEKLFSISVPKEKTHLRLMLAFISAKR
jgi:hypothetical protein